VNGPVGWLFDGVRSWVASLEFDELGVGLNKLSWLTHAEFG
jgi:hypothetical protein